MQDHPDSGRILHPDSGRALTASQLVTELAGEPLVLLGEKHDNPDHHALQLWLLQALEQQRTQGSLLLEMLTRSQQARVDSVRSRLAQGQAMTDLPAALEWNRGWDWQQYGALVEYALARPWPLRAGNLDRADLLSIYRKPPPLPAGPAAAEQVQEQLAAIISESHCGKLPDTQVPAMVAVQQQRDLALAGALLESPRPGLLVAGAYHVRKDLGVPLHVRTLSPGQTFKVLIFLEAGQVVAPGMADYVWYTPAAAERDYCADL